MSDKNVLVDHSHCHDTQLDKQSQQKGWQGMHRPRALRSGGPVYNKKLRGYILRCLGFHGCKINKSTASSESFKTIIHASRPIPISFHTHRQPMAVHLLPAYASVATR